MREVVSVALFALSVGLSSAAVLHLMSSDRIGARRAVIWTVVLALCWGAWYYVQFSR